MSWRISRLNLKKQTNFRECYICQEAQVLLVLLDGLRLDNDVVGDVTVATPADEGSPVIVQSTRDHLLTTLGSFVQDHFCKVNKAASTKHSYQRFDICTFQNWHIFHLYRQSCLDMQTQFFQMDVSLSKREYCLGRNPFKEFNVDIHYSFKRQQALTGHGSD